MDFYEECKSDTKHHSESKVEQLLSTLDKKESESLRKALLDSAISTRTIERVLQKNKINCGMWAINQWRREQNVPFGKKVLIEEGK